MAHLVDIIVFVWCLFLLSNGWRKGFLRTLVGPISLCISIALAFIYFEKTRNIAGALLGTLFGPLAVSLILYFFVGLWHRNIDKGVPPEWPSRLLGSIFNLLWGSCIVISTILIAAVLPSPAPRMQALRENIVSSWSYFLIEKFIKNKIPFIDQTETIIKVSQDPKKLSEFQSVPEFTAIYNDSKIQKLLSDKKTLEQIQNRDIAELLQNPTFLALWQDEKLFLKMMDLSKRIIEKESPPEKESSSPKVYEVK